MDNTGELRLQVYLSRSGVGSRRNCEEYIRQGRVQVNGKKIVEMGTKIDPVLDIVHFDGKSVEFETEKVYIALNKPRGYLCTNYDEFDRPIALDLVQDDFKQRLFHVGRLDFLSKGLIFFTNDGYFTKIVTHPSSEVEKEYIVEAVNKIPESVLTLFSKGIEIEGEYYTFRSFSLLNDTKVDITLIEGKNREIRNVFDFFSIKIQNLTRIRIGNVKIGNLRPGSYRNLKQEEINFFNKEEK